MNALSPQLAEVLREMAVDAEASGAASDVFDVFAYRQVLAFNRGALAPDVRIELAERRGIAVRTVSPIHAAPMATLLYLHGGGLVAGGWGSHRCLVTWLANTARVRVVFPEFRLAPEHPYPAALDDAVAVFRDSAEWAQHDSGGRSEILLAGDSSGAGLAIAAALRLARDAGPAPAGILALCPMLSFDPNSSAYVRDSRVGRELAFAYTAGADPADPLVSPINCDASRLPPVFIQASDADKFFPEAVRLEQRVSAAGGRCRLATWRGLPHVWQRFAPRLPEALAALQEISKMIDWLGDREGCVSSDS